jgi:hypothetical protein
LCVPVCVCVCVSVCVCVCLCFSFCLSGSVCPWFCLSRSQSPSLHPFFSDVCLWSDLVCCVCVYMCVCAFGVALAGDRVLVRQAKMETRFATDLVSRKKLRLGKFAMKQRDFMIHEPRLNQSNALLKYYFFAREQLSEVPKHQPPHCCSLVCTVVVVGTAILNHVRIHRSTPF